MKKNRISNKTIALVAAAMLLFAGGTFTGTRAVLNIFSPEHFLEFETDHQQVQIQENGKASTTLLTKLEGKVVVGKKYDEQISAKNTTTDADQFVRIVIRKYWKNAKDKKAKDLDKEDLNKIKLTFVNTDLWQKNELESTAEREVYYYKNVVPAGEVTEPLTKDISVDTSVMSQYTTQPDFDPDNVPVGTIITYAYDFDGYQICLEAEAQSIQTHNAQEAVMSIWGMPNVTVSGSTLTVK